LLGVEIEEQRQEEGRTIARKGEGLVSHGEKLGWSRRSTTRD
jgi:hypothetical protein